MSEAMIALLGRPETALKGAPLLETMIPENPVAPAHRRVSPFADMAILPPKTLAETAGAPA